MAIKVVFRLFFSCLFSGRLLKSLLRFKLSSKFQKPWCKIVEYLSTNRWIYFYHLLVNYRSSGGLCLHPWNLQKGKACDIIKLKNCDQQRPYLYGTSLLGADILLVILLIVTTTLQDRVKEGVSLSSFHRWKNQDLSRLMSSFLVLLKWMQMIFMPGKPKGERKVIG